MFDVHHDDSGHGGQYDCMISYYIHDHQVDDDNDDNDFDDDNDGQYDVECGW